MANEGNLKPFVKNDPRINRKGRPKNMDTLRKLAQSIANEVPLDKSGNRLMVGEHFATVSEAILRQWANSKNPQHQKLFMEYAYGKPSSELILSGKDDSPVPIKFVKEVRLE